MKDIPKKIAKICREIEKKNKIKILFAVENGSRAWRMESKDSDYDVRFVFARPLEEYITISKPADVLNFAFDENLEPHSAEGSFIDMSGFDVFKFCSLLAGSNPTTIEWLVSDIVYHGKQNPVFKNFALKNFSAVALYFHYKSLSKNNYIKYIKSGNDVTYKRYLYSFRGLINARWVVFNKSVPPIGFFDALGGIREKLPKEIYQKLQEIIKIKLSGKEKEKIANIKEMDDYIENFLNDDSEAPRGEKRADVTGLNKELKKILK